MPAENRAFDIIWLILLIAASLIRFYDLSRFSLWLDEYTSIEVATKSLRGILTGDGFDRATPPFYYVVLHLWFALVTPSELTLRLPSAVFDVGSILLLARFLSHHFSRDLVRLTTLLYAFSPFAIYFAQEGRMYSLLSFLCLLTLNLISKKSPLAVVALFVTATCGLYTHYYYGFFIAGIGLYLLLKKEYRAVVAIALAGGVFLPWVGVIVSLASSGGQSFRPLSPQAIPYLFFRFLAGYAVFPLDSVTKADTAKAVKESLPLLATITLLSAVLIGVGIWKMRRAVVLFPILTSTILPLLISLKIPMFSERYLAGVYPLFCLLFAVGALALCKVIPKFTTLFLVGVFSLGNYSYFGGEKRFGKEQWREVGEYVAGRDVLIDPPFATELLRFYCKGCSITSLHEWDGAEDAILVRRGKGEIPDPTVLVKHVVFPHESGVFVYLVKAKKS